MASYPTGRDPQTEKLVIDLAVIKFLETKGVDVQPPKETSALANAFAGAVTGGAGIVAGGLLHLSRNQMKNQAQQEWTSWKQWALSHEEWPSFLEQNRDSYLTVVRKELMAKQALDAKKAESKRKIHRNGIIAVTSPLWITAILFAMITPFYIYQMVRTGCFFDVECIEQYDARQNSRR